MKLTRLPMPLIAVALAILFNMAGTPVLNTVVVDATPSHVVNTFSPPHALGGAIDRLRAGTGAPGPEGRILSKQEIDQNTDTLLRDPMLKEILGAGWQAVTYRQ